MGSIRKVLAVLLIVGVAASASAAPRNWVAPVGSTAWNLGTNWAPVGVPLAGDDVYVVYTGTESQLAIYVDPAAPMFDYVEVDDVLPGLGMTLEQQAFTLNSQEMEVGVDGIGIYELLGGTANLEAFRVGKNSAGDGYVSMNNTYGVPALNTNWTLIGTQGTGYFEHWAGTHTASIVLSLGADGGSSGHYILKPDGIINSQKTVVGKFAVGLFDHEGGTHNITTELIVGSEVFGDGTYNLIDGAVNAPKVTLGYTQLGNPQVGTGVFNQTGGAVNATSVYVGESANGAGTYDISGGDLVSTNQYIGYSGTGDFTQNGDCLNQVTTLYLGHQSGGDGTYNLEDGTLNAGTAYVGRMGLGEFNQNGGTHTVSGGAALYVGYNSGSTGTYNLGSGALATPSTVVGYSGPGSFNQTGGTHTVTGMLMLAHEGGGVGTYTLDDGAVSTGITSVGVEGAGTFIQNGGVHQVSSSLWLGRIFGTGSYELTDGELTVGVEETVGDHGPGSFTQTGGTHTVNHLYVGYAQVATGSYALGGGDLGAQAEYVGYEGNGTFTQTDGTHTITGNLVLGQSSTSYGQYDLSGGDLQATTEFIGYNGTGVFNQTGGTNTATYSLHIGYGESGDGTYTLGDGTLSVGVYTYVGSGGTGLFTQTGGTHTVGTSMVVGDDQSAQGAYDLQDGSLAGMHEVVGRYGIGVFDHSGGTNTLTGDLWLGYYEGGDGTYNLSGTGDLSAADVTVGHNSIGTFNQTGGTATISGSLTLSENLSSSGSYDLSDGSLSVGDDEIVGKEGVGTFTQSGGTHAVTHNLFMGQGQSAGGSHFALSGGSLDVGLNTFVGYECQASFNQSGSGAHSVHELIVAYSIGEGGEGESTYTLSNGAPLDVASDEAIGYNAQGRFIQNNGAHSVGARLMLGYSYGYGSFELGLGTLDTGDTYVGYEGYGDFVQDGGSHTVTGSLVLGENDDSGGTYTLNDGALSANAEILGGGSGTWGEFYQYGGTNTVTTTLEVADDSGGEEPGTGTYHLEDGALTSADIDNNGTVNQSGGTLDTGLFQNDGLFNHTGGTMTADTFNNAGSLTTYVYDPAVFQADTVNNNSEFYFYGGTVRGATSLMGTFNNYGSLYMYGGTFEDYLVNQSYFYYGGGTFNGIYEHWTNATFDRDGDFTAEGGIINYGTLTSSPGNSLNANGFGIHNYAWFYLQGGTTNVTTFTNDFGGVFSGTGTINGDLVNNGRLDTEGLLVVTGSTTNLGLITVEQSEHFRATAGLSNSGIVELQGGSVSGPGAFVNGPGGILRGYGGVTAPVSNNGGVIHATGSQLTITTLSGGNLNGGELRVEDGCRLHVVDTFSSTGTIVLNGENADLLGGAIRSDGTLRGSGRVSNVVINTGVIRASGGALTLSAAGNTNDPDGRIEVFNGAALVYSQGLATNEGTIAMTGGTFDTNATAMTNTGSILGRGTIATGGLTNDDLMSFADGPTDIYGDVTNNDTINVTECTTTFFGDVTNAGGATIKNQDGVVRILGNFINNGTYDSDPADNYFTDVGVGTAGVFTGGTGDRFFVSGDFANASAAAAAWETSDAELIFQGGAGHAFGMPGSDIGAFYSGLIDNYAWGALRLVAGDSLLLADGNAVPGAATYVTGLILEDGLAQIASITGNGFSIYYDPLSPDNAYLNAQTYPLAGGGVVAPMGAGQPIPEPAGLGLVGLGLLALRRRRGL